MDFDFGAKKFDLREVRFTPELLRCVPAEVARLYRVLPVAVSPRCVCLAVADASDVDVLDSLAHVLKRDIEVGVAESSQLTEFIRRLYGDEPG